MESGKELRMESFSSLGSSAEQQPPTEEAEKESEESLPEGQGSLSQRKVCIFEYKLGPVLRFQSCFCSLKKANSLTNTPFNVNRYIRAVHTVSLFPAVVVIME